MCSESAQRFNEAVDRFLRQLSSLWKRALFLETPDCGARLVN